MSRLETVTVAWLARRLAELDIAALVVSVRLRSDDRRGDRRAPPARRASADESGGNVNARFRISYKKGPKVNVETGYVWTITGDGVGVSGWSAGKKSDAVAEAERKLAELARATKRSA